jgi:phage-related protein
MRHVEDDRVNALSPNTKKLIAVFVALGAILVPLVVTAGMVAAAIGAIAAIGAATLLPIVAIVAGLVALGAVLVVLWKKSAIFREMVLSSFAAMYVGVMKVVGELRKTLAVWGGWLKSFWKSNGANILATVQRVFGGIRTAISVVMSVVKNIIITALRVLRGDWSGAWESMKAAASKALEGVKLVLTRFLPWVFGVGKKIASGLAKGLASAFSAGAGFVADIGRGLSNYVIGLLNKAIPNSIPLPGKNLDIPDNPIPRLATGGIVTRPTLALVGEAGPEAVIPLSKASRSRAGLPELGTGKPSQIVMNFRGDPDVWSASRQAAFAVRTAGLVGR